MFRISLTCLDYLLNDSSLYGNSLLCAIKLLQKVSILCVQNKYTWRERDDELGTNHHYKVAWTTWIITGAFPSVRKKTSQSELSIKFVPSSKLTLSFGLVYFTLIFFSIANQNLKQAPSNYKNMRFGWCCWLMIMYVFWMYFALHFVHGTYFKKIQVLKLNWIGILPCRLSP